MRLCQPIAALEEGIRLGNLLKCVLPKSQWIWIFANGLHFNDKEFPGYIGSLALVVNGLIDTVPNLLALWKFLSVVSHPWHQSTVLHRSFITHFGHSYLFVHFGYSFSLLKLV